MNDQPSKLTSKLNAAHLPLSLINAKSPITAKHHTNGAPKKRSGTISRRYFKPCITSVDVAYCRAYETVQNQNFANTPARYSTAQVSKYGITAPAPYTPSRAGN